MPTKPELEEQVTQLQNRVDGLEQEKLRADAELEQLRREREESQAAQEQARADRDRARQELRQEKERAEAANDEAQRQLNRAVMDADRANRDVQVRDELLEALRTQLQEREQRIQQLEQDRRAELPVAHERRRQSESRESVDGRAGDRDGTPVPADQTQPRIYLPALPQFSGEGSSDEGDFERWVRKLQKHAELRGWTDRQTMVQFELHLSGRAESLYELLPSTTRESLDTAIQALCGRLYPVQREALSSAKLMMRKQQDGETVDAYVTDFEQLFGRSYGRRQGMDEESKELLKRDLFVQGLRLKWQERVLPSAATFADALHQARAAEEQERQLAELHKAKPNKKESSGSSMPPKQTPKYYPSRTHGSETTTPSENSNHKPGVKSSRPRAQIQCYSCGGFGHRAAQCRRRSPSEATGRSGRGEVATNQVGSTDTRPAEHLSEKCQRLQEEWTEAEFARMRACYDQSLEVSNVAGALGPLYYAEVTVAGTPVEALIDPGSSATILSFDLFMRIGKTAGITSKELRPPRVTLRDYNGRPIPIGAQVDLQFEWKGTSVTAPVYLRTEKGDTRSEQCLLGTNVVMPLGLMVPGEGIQARGEAKDTEPRSPQTVRLIKSQHIPGRCGAIVEAEIGGLTSTEQTALLQPKETWIQETGLVIEEALVQPDEQGHVFLLVQNPTSSPKLVRSDDTICEADFSIKETNLEDPSELLLTPDAETVNMVSATKVDAADTTSSQDERQRQLAEKLRTDLTREDAAYLLQCVTKAHDVFAIGPRDQGRVEQVEHKIETGDHPPIKQPLRRVPFALRPVIARMVQEMLDAGVVQESSSPWASPIVLVKKKNGEMRFCVDYRRLNAVTRKDVFPLPRIDDLLDQLKGKTVFSILDAKSGYWQIKMERESQEKTAFVTTQGLYEFRVMPFGLCNAPATFQRLMQKILAGLGGDTPFCDVYIDDIIVFSSNLRDHISHLEQVFSRLRRAGLKLHLGKCQFGCPEVLYLGHIISAAGVAPNPEKVAAVRDFPTPTSVQTVRQFLGLASYYRRFIRNFAKIASPLHALTRQDVPFVWTLSCQNSFQQLKDHLISAPVLVYPDFTKPFTLHTDASGEGLGAVLEQEQPDGRPHPIAYASRTLNTHERKYGITELEALGVVWAARHFRAYLYGHQCVVYTDHAALKTMLTARHQTGKLARWGQTLAELELDIQYKPGRANSNADALSRSPLLGAQEAVNSPGEEEAQVATVSADLESMESANTRQLQQQDPELAEIICFIEEDKIPDDDKRARKLALQRSSFALLEGVLHYVDPARRDRPRLAVPSELRKELMQETHSGGFSGHFATKGLYEKLARRFWWNNMYSDIHRFCRSCLTCAAYRGSGRRHRPPLQPIPVGGPWERLGVDILEMPLTANGHKYVIVFVEYLTKWVEAFPTADQTSMTIVRLLVDHVICRHGAPQELLSDRGPNLLSELIQDICEIVGTKKINTTAYHPQTDGLVENFNKTLRAMIAKHAHKFGPEWDVYLQHLLFAYRTKPHETTGESPFFLLYGRDARLPTETTLAHVKTPYQVDIEDYKTEVMVGLSEAWRNAKGNISKAQRKQKSHYDRHAKEPHYQPGERVMVYMPAEDTGRNRKLALPYHGPYRILEVRPNCVLVRPVDQADLQPILVSMDRVVPCDDALPDVSWLGPKRQSKKRKEQRQAADDQLQPKEPPLHHYSLRSRN